MKRNVSIAILIALMTSGCVACNNPDIKNKNSTTQTDTSSKRQVMVTDEMYTCKMHNDVLSDKPGKCPKCGMALVKQKMTNEQMKMMEEGTYIKPKD